MKFCLILACSAAMLSAAQPAFAAHRSNAVGAASRTVCVPLRDRLNRPTGATICRTAVQWEKILARRFGRPITETVPFQLQVPRG